MNNTKTLKETLKLLEEEIAQLTQEGRNVIKLQILILFKTISPILQMILIRKNLI